MATSGTYSFNATRDQIITSALRKVQAIAEGDAPSTDQITNGTFVLNAVLKAAEADGMPLWATVDVTIPCSSFTNGQIVLGPTGPLPTVPVPLRVLYGYNRDNSVPSSPQDIPLTPLTRYDYNWLSAKFSTGTTVQYMYEPYNQNQSGTLFLWPVPDSYSNLYRSIVITYQREFQDAGDPTDTLDFPPYWTLALIYRLAWMLAPEYGMPPNDRSALAAESKALWDMAIGGGTEEGSLFLEPDWSRMYMGQGSHGGM